MKKFLFISICIMLSYPFCLSSLTLNSSLNLNFDMGNFATLNNEQTSITASTLTLNYNGKIFIYKPPIAPNFHINYYLQNALFEVQKMGATNVYLQGLKQGKTQIEALDYFLFGFKDFYENVAIEIEKPFVLNKMNFNPNAKQMFSLERGQDGVKIDVNSLANDILSGQTNITIKTITQQNEFTCDELEQNTTFRASGKTSIAGSEENRRFNVIKALNCFNGLVVNPGERVSFNSVLQQKHNGIPYKQATVIVNGEFVKGTGGGICQASTTIFNAVLLSGLNIIEAHTHTLPVGYVERGFDATVNDTNLDLKFENNTPYPIYFKCGASGNEVYANIYGQSLGGVKYSKYSEVEKIQPPEPLVLEDKENEFNLQEGEFYTKLYAQYGYKVKAYLVKEQGGFQTKTLIRQAVYKPTQSIIYKGIKKEE